MITRLNHIGISVADLHRSIGFYRDLLGFRLEVEQEFRGETLEKIMALAGARGQVVLLTGFHLELEIFEFAHPRSDERRAVKHVSEFGISHFCLEVDDIDSEYARLNSAGVHFHCEPLEVSAHERATYCRDPDGNVIELLQRKDPGA